MDEESEISVRVATRSDAAAVCEIYAPFCESSAVTFEETPPSIDEMAARIASTLETYPWLVAARDGTVIGYAYAGKLRKRQAYQWVVELSVYVAEAARGLGVGRTLYESLFAILERQGVRDAYAVTTLPNPATVRFHERLDFERLVEFPAMGYTDGDWHDVAWWRRRLGEKGDEPAPIIPFPTVRDDPEFQSLLGVGEDTIQG
ncbi:GNAT family N-acetyltransferase [Natrarchaeobaculum sulfurireducens]|uniref:Sortase or related acyltransferase n=1 Tax=Natrarchaeobaculum sulfurireducens TaxID=2044521 RepID=A0A346PVE6_9EURY|nr:GNAT family N-acetyltransferase [Natrarchaeobaculum sulfurireducens]AXR79752.1 Sortase or related acyltransferase [Natrarchaeobaculum sulfurireducens]AXR83491.1 Sortase or related acyltransferase [Natrarchaeobaculum sulfurireducens]